MKTRSGARIAPSRPAWDAALVAAYIQFPPGLIADDGHVTNESTAAFLCNYLQEFAGFIERVYMAIPRRG